MSDPLGNATHTALSFNVVGEDVLVTGAGPIGLMSVPILKRAGARSIVVSDINPERLQLAMDLGATAVVDVRTETIESAMTKLDLIKEGFDVGLEMSGNGIAFNSMIDVMANGGKIAILGILPSRLQIDWDKVIFNSLTLKGIYGRHMFDTWYRMSALLQSGLDKEVEKVITHHFHYTDFEEAFELMRSGKSGKVILNWE
jgi:threonine 3-dehydrogenase